MLIIFCPLEQNQRVRRRTVSLDKKQEKSPRWMIFSAYGYHEVSFHSALYLHKLKFRMKDWPNGNTSFKKKPTHMHAKLPWKHSFVFSVHINEKRRGDWNMIRYHKRSTVISDSNQQRNAVLHKEPQTEMRERSSRSHQILWKNGNLFNRGI